MKGDAILSVHRGDLREVAELWRNGATELIGVELPESDNDAMRIIEFASCSQRFYNNNAKSEIIRSK